MNPETPQTNGPPAAIAGPGCMQIKLWHRSPNFAAAVDKTSHQRAEEPSSTARLSWNSRGLLNSGRGYDVSVCFLWG